MLQSNSARTWLSVVANITWVSYLSNNEHPSKNRRTQKLLPISAAVSAYKYNERTSNMITFRLNWTVGNNFVIDRLRTCMHCVFCAQVVLLYSALPDTPIMTSRTDCYRWFWCSNDARQRTISNFRRDQRGLIYGLLSASNHVKSQNWRQL